MNLRYLFCVCLTPLIQVLGQPLIAQEEAIVYSGITESRLMFQDNCAVCHGENLEGAAQGPPLRGDLIYGASIEEIIASIGSGYPNAGMPAWRNVFSPLDIQNLAMYVMETRDNVDYVTSNYDAPLVVPTGVFETELHNFRLQTLVDDLDPLPFSLSASSRWKAAGYGEDQGCSHHWYATVKNRKSLKVHLQPTMTFIAMNCA